MLRALTREPEVLEAWITEVGAARGADHRLDRAVDDTLALLGDVAGLEVGARRLAGQMAACLQGSLLVRFAPPEVADAFCASRLGTSYNGTFGTLRRRRPARHRRPHHPGALMATREWDASTYDSLPLPHVAWGQRVLDRMRLEGDERVLDAGCGTGRDGAALLARWPDVRLVGIDGSEQMIDGGS